MTALLVTSLIVMLFLNQSAFLLRFDKKAASEVTMYRRLYEETAQFSRFRESGENFQAGEYRFAFAEKNGYLYKAAVWHGEGFAEVERK